MSDPADIPKTDRELLLIIKVQLDEIKNILRGPDGKSGLVGEVEQLKRDRWYLAGAIALMLMLVGAGRVIDVLSILK